MNSLVSTVVLWDIDNTLLYTGGAGSRAMARAFVELYGTSDAFKRIEFSGRTDTAIFFDAARAHGLPQTRWMLERDRFREAYVPHLRAALVESDGVGGLMPGVGALLDALAQADGVRQGLGTGNFRGGGELKLHHYGIGGYFPGMLGGFGEDSDSRDTVIATAIERMSKGRRPERVVVIGDTPHDVTAARANGAFALAVATGRNDAAELAACGADFVMADLSDTVAALRVIRG
jgi:phosphoglycolate phosphatase